MRHQRLLTIAGKTIWVFAPPILECALARDIHQELKSAVFDLSLPVWPPSLPLENGLTLAEFIYEQVREQFEDMARFLKIDVSLDDIDPESRHLFFICTEPVPHWERSNEMVQGLSLLDQLLGLSMPTRSSSNSSSRLSSGDLDADMMAALLLNFKSAGLRLANTRGLGYDFINKVFEQASNLQQEARKQSEQPKRRILPAIAPGEDDPFFIANKSVIKGKLLALNIPLPDEF